MGDYTQETGKKAYNCIMDEISYKRAHLEDLATQCANKNYLTASSFFGFSELSSLNLPKDYFSGAPYFLYGGHPNAERNIVVFYPDYLDELSILEEEKKEATLISCLLLEPKSQKFGEELSHRDVLGSLMALGIKRETLGDILLDGKKAVIYCLNNIAEEILNGLHAIRNTSIKVKKIAIGESPIESKYIEMTLKVASIRLDSILAAAFKISREKAKEHIVAGNVTVTGLAVPQSDSSLSIGAHVSLKGKGKFIYKGQEGTSKKGKDIVVIDMAD